MKTWNGIIPLPKDNDDDDSRTRLPGYDFAKSFQPVVLKVTNIVVPTRVTTVELIEQWWSRFTAKGKKP